LQTEDRQARIRQEKERYRQLINDLKRLERSQRSTRSQTERGGELKGIEDQQQQINEKASDLKARLDEENSQKKEQEPTEQDASNDSQSEDTPKKAPEERKENQKEDLGTDPSQKQEGQNSQQGAQSPQQRAANQVQQAQEQMRKALEKLRQQASQEAAESQMSAEESLRAAAEQLERILKQLREEEIQRQLVKLEGRLRELVTRQTQVLEKTRTIAVVPMEQRDRQLDIQASNLSFEEKKIALDADRALLLLAEDGTGHAFPEVLEEVRDDMYRVATRLSQSQVDTVTQGLQEDILSTLEEMIKALQQEQRKREQNEQGQPPSGQPAGDQQQEEPLVDKIAELKLIKTQEVRIKNATERYTDVAKRAAQDADLTQLLGELSQRQIRLYRVVKEIVIESSR
jgi:hypothetical protein